MNRSVSNWIAQAKRGDQDAAAKLWKRFYARLVRDVERRLAAPERRLADEEDIAISTFGSFFRAARVGRFPQLRDRTQCWRLLRRMAARKVIDQRRRAHRLKRGGVEGPRGSNAPGGCSQLVAREPLPENRVADQETVELLLAILPTARDQAIALAKAEGRTSREIAEQWKCSERTIEHRLKLIRVKWTHALAKQRRSSDVPK